MINFAKLVFEFVSFIFLIFLDHVVIGDKQYYLFNDEEK